MNEQSTETSTAVEAVEATQEEQPVEGGISQLIPLGLLAAEIGNVTEKMVKGNYAALMELADEAFALKNVDFHLAFRQLKDIDTAEAKQYREILAEKLDLQNDKIELIVESSLAAIEILYSAFVSCRSLYVHIKAAKKVQA